MAVKNHTDRMDKNGVQAYLAGQGTAAERENWEEILLEDEDALSLYMASLEEVQDELPPLNDPVSFTSKVMESLSIADGLSIKKMAEPRRTRWYEKAVFHYVVAASLTLLFLSSGVFDKLLTGNMDVVVQTSDAGPSYTEQAMQATSGWLNQLMNKGNN
jgi:hypothetical protein